MRAVLEVLRSRASFLILAALGLAVIWLPARPPMVDLPQHAGQLALLRDIALGQSPWAGQLSVNFFTPYLLGYCLAAPLTLVLAPLSAMKVVLSGAFLAFFGLARLIRRELGSAAELDALAAIPFFGFAYSWGFYSYLVAAPVGLGFIWLSLKYSRTGSPRYGLAMAAVAIAMLFSHGLVFLFACAVGATLILVNSRNVFQAALRAWPFALAGVIAIVLFLAISDRESAIKSDFSRLVDMGSIPARVTMLAFNSFDAPVAAWPALAFAAVVALPLLGGLRIDWRRREAVAIAACIAAILLLAPSIAWSTSLLYERLVLFLLPAFAWLFVRPEPAAQSRWRLAPPMLALAAGVAAAGVLVKHAADGVAFSAEARDFDAVMARAEPGQRALMLIFDPSSATPVNRGVYVHFPAWYEAEKHGLVDFNFAVFHPELVRFVPAARPPIGESISWRPQTFDWARDRGSSYRYVFVRRSAPLPSTPFAGAPAPPRLIAREGEWELYENAAP